MNYRILSIIFIVTMVVLIWAKYEHSVSFWHFLIPVLVFMPFLVLGAIFIQLNFFVKSVNTVAMFPFKTGIDESKKNICLTFDDGIHAINTPQALDILKRKNVKAHFFIIGKNIAGHEDILRRMHDEGHCIGNHSFHHGWNFDLQSTTAMQQEIDNTNKLIKANIGVKPTIFRPPYGVTNPNLARAIQNSQMLSMGWNLRSLDTVAKSREELLHKLKSNTKPNSVVLLHERCDVTVDVLTEYIDYCLLEGYTFVTLKTPDEI